MEPWNHYEKTAIKQNFVELWFHGTGEHVEPQFVNLSLSNNASKTGLRWQAKIANEH